MTIIIVLVVTVVIESFLLAYKLAAFYHSYLADPPPVGSGVVAPDVKIDDVHVTRALHFGHHIQSHIGREVGQECVVHQHLSNRTSHCRYVSECEEIRRKYGTVEGREGGRGGRVGGGRVGGGGGGGVTEEGENLMTNVHAVNCRICCC